MDFNFQKAQQSLDDLSFGNRLSAVWSLVKSTLSIIGKDDDIIKPWIRMIIYHLIMIMAFFYFILGFLLPFPYYGLGLLVSFSLFLYKCFYNNKQEMRLSWTVYETIIGHDPSYKGATKSSKEVKSEIRRLAWLDIGMSVASKSKGSGGGGMLQFIVRMVIEGIEEVWDLANNYLIPSIAIDRRGFKESISEMKTLKDRVPETLVGVFGIDFIGKVVRRCTRPVYFVLFVISIAAGFWLGPKFPSISFPVDIDGTESLLGNSAHLTLLPTVIALFLGKVFSVFFERTITSLKVVYFTVFYTKITHPNRIAKTYREELLAYLKMKDVDEMKDLDKQGTAEEAAGEDDTQISTNPATA